VEDEGKPNKVVAGGKLDRVEVVGKVYRFRMEANILDFGWRKTR